ncbi:SulP family inorganic anion transporter [Trueperella bialowiezensis]|uniref:Sulfate transporter ychM n=1 Tax=Trueperella bialowiezensis TaxID=312285 RepID=A0A448PFT6_9ACTO|nr:SulP family inorganic anion transporter [Trueperella bialowiezensis]VEI13805.1 Putative sulfate transporter ychM [Trueperella bialowiezensis]
MERLKALSHVKSLLPQKQDLEEVKRHWKGDILAGITTGIVALPLALAFGAASGVGAAAGLITAIVAGLVGAIFGGSRFQVSGPTGAMVVILAPLVATHGLHAVPLLSIMAALILFAAALLGLGRIISLIPWPVIEGFTLGIALILFLQQVPNALGVDVAAGGNTLITAGWAVVNAPYPQAFIPLAVALGTVLLIVVFDSIHPSFPGSLAALAVVSVVVVVTNTNVPLIGEIPDSLPAPHLPAVSPDLFVALLPGAISVAFLAGIESLLSARVASGMVEGGTYNPDRELFGQGAANFAAGVFGGMPATGAIVRTAVNIRSGGRSRLSPVIHSLLLLVVVYSLSDVVRQIPMAALAGILFVTSARMVPVKATKQILRSTRSDAVVFILTVIITLVFDLIVAIAIGVLVAGVLMLRHFARSSGVHREYPTKNNKIRVLRIDGAMFFGVADRIEEEITSLDDVRVVIIRLSRVGVMDATGAKALTDIVTTLRRADNNVLLVGLRTSHEALTERLGLGAAMGGADRFFDDMDDAVAAAERIIAEEIAAKEAEREAEREAAKSGADKPAKAAPRKRRIHVDRLRERVKQLRQIQRRRFKRPRRSTSSKS